MGAGGVPNRSVEIVFGRRLESTGKPNARVDRYDNKKRLVQSRWYDDKGHAIRNRDYSHSGQYSFPHDHSWSWDNENGVRGEDHLSPDYDNFN